LVTHWLQLGCIYFRMMTFCNAGSLVTIQKVYFRSHHATVTSLGIVQNLSLSVSIWDW